MTDEYYKLVPKDFHANLQFRRDMVHMGAESRAAAKQLWVMCSRDPLFFVNTFAWTFDPRRDPAALPFITYPFQDEGIMDFIAAIEGGYDILVEKSRDMGASWMLVTVFEWLWQFRELQSFLLVSRKEELVDKRGDPKSLFWKVDFLLKNQPDWLKPGLNRQKLHLHNKDNGSTIDGESTTGDVARGDRRTAIGLDEFASVDNGYQALAATADATNCRIFNSTPKGTGNAFFDVATSGQTKKLRFHWTEHPIKSVDTTIDHNGRPTSPWYEAEKLRRSHPMEIAQELDIDYLGSDFQFFDAIKVEAYRKDCCKKWMLRGELDFSPLSCNPNQLIPGDNGSLKLWALPDPQGYMPSDSNYSMGIDVSTGTGASNSVISVAKNTTGEKVAEWVSSSTSIDEMVKTAIAMARWFRGANGLGAFMVWESNGPGGSFGQKIIDYGYRNFYYRENDVRIAASPSFNPGWASSSRTKLKLLEAYRSALNGRHFINYSDDAIKECREYIYLTNGTIAHARSAYNVDPSGARDNHGDRVMADALCFHGLRRVPARNIEDEDKIREGSYAWRREGRKQKERDLAKELVGW